ncbi:hypothetical protein BOO71_0004474 [Deinococcus marmoris]|uniref:Uncharacterized protein n=1 Tax=Deinococcus marmoris TaxID=249408 RepID=A0A1U7P144_9DEIO|nr:hypothetical protein BOO71_0004474 [Deinococcus marmoris]
MNPPGKSRGRHLEMATRQREPVQCRVVVGFPARSIYELA